MGNGIRVKHSHIWQNPNKKRKPTWNKYKNSIKTYLKLLKREEIEGETKWIQNAKARVEIKFKKYGITEQMINSHK